MGTNTSELARVSLGLDVSRTLPEEVAELKRQLAELTLLAEQAAATTALVNAVHDSAPVGFAHLDRDLVFLRVNEALARMNQLRVDEHLGRPLAEVAPATWPQLEPVCRAVLETGEAVVNHEVVGEGTAGPSGHWLNSIYAIRMGGEIVGLGCLVVDVTAWIRAEEFRAVVTETMVEGLYALDADGRLTFVNAAAIQMLGWSEEELRARNVHETIHFQRADGGLLSETECQLSRVSTEGQAVEAVYDVFTRRDGTLLPVIYSAAPLAAEQGRGLVVVFRDGTKERDERLSAQRDLDAVFWLGETRKAIDEDRLVLYSQPITPLGDEPPSEELLLRMIGRDGSSVTPPGAFLPVAEEFGLIAEIDRWVIGRAAELAAQGRRIAVNLSPKSIDVRLLGYIESTLRDAGADPVNVMFELTETGLMSDITAGVKFAHGVREIGCRLALDDFGTGFASLTYLKVLPVQYLKIDVEFVRDLATNQTNQHLVRTIVSLARGLGQKTIAEGVEDEETLALLRQYDVDFAQGYLLGRPAPLTTPAE
jgi:PAS domain S-box-containing protein